MSVRFKFRSSPNFDSVDIGGLPWISVRDLKSKIVQNKKLNVCQDFDLVFSDHISGEEYIGEDCKIPCGSSVIIKRVPAGSVPSNKVRGGMIGDLTAINVNTMKASIPKIAETVDFDDFGDDLCPVPQPTLSGIYLDTDKNHCIDNEEINFEMKRCSELPRAECQKLDGSDISEAVPRGHSGVGDAAPETKSRPNADEQIAKFLKAMEANPPALQFTDFPPELKCFLCNTYFKNAVMIPCCQHSFCEKCISQVLVENARCPKCFSTKYRVENLLPNVSLRHAIEHFLESGLNIIGSENDFRGYAPDGESGIEAKDVSCAISIHQKEHCLPPSSSATGNGSNQVVVEAIGDRVRYGSARHVDLKNGTGNLADFDEFQGESKPIRDEAESNIMAKGTQQIKAKDGKQSFMEAGKYKKGRTCYTCGSPDHLMRDCPVAASQHPMFQMGHSMFPGAMPVYPSPYWDGSSFPQVRPYATAFGNAGMMPFNTTMVPGTPYPGTMFMRPIFGGPPAYSGYMGMGGWTAPMKDNREHHINHADLDAEDCKKRHQFSSEKMTRQPSPDDNDDTNRRSQADELRKKRSYDRERSVSPSDESFGQKSNRKHGRRDNQDDDTYLHKKKHEKSSRSSARGHSSHHHSDRSRSEIENLPSSSSRHSEGAHKGHHKSSKKLHDRRERELCGSDSSWDHHPSNKDKNVKRKIDYHDVERHKEKHHHSQKEKRNEKDFIRSARHSGNHSKGNDESGHDKWPMVNKGSDENAQEDYHHRHHLHNHKRKRDY